MAYNPLAWMRERIVRPTYRRVYKPYIDPHIERIRITALRVRREAKQYVPTVSYEVAAERRKRVVDIVRRKRRKPPAPVGFQEKIVSQKATALRNLESQYTKAGRIAPTGEFLPTATINVERKYARDITPTGEFKTAHTDVVINEWAPSIRGQNFIGTKEQFTHYQSEFNVAQQKDKARYSAYKRDWGVAQQADKKVYGAYQSKYKEYESERIKLATLKVEKRKELKEFVTYPIYKETVEFGRWWEEKIVPKKLRPETPAPIKPLAKFGVGLIRSPGQVVSFFGMVPSAAEYAARDADEFAVSLVPGAVVAGKGIVEAAKERPAEFAGEMVGMALVTGGVVKGVRLAPKISPYYKGPIRGIKPYTGEPRFFNKLLLGEKAHPTPKGEMRVLLKEKIFEEELPYYHGASMKLVKAISKEGEITISPEAVGMRGIAGIEKSLFFSGPKQPYLRFATPERILRIGKGIEAREIPITKLEQAMRGKLSKAEAKELGIKGVKPSTKLRGLIRERTTLERGLAELEKKPLSEVSVKRMRTESRLYDISRKVEGQIAKEYKTAIGEYARIVDEPGAFLEWKTKPTKPSVRVIEKAFRREELRGKEKAKVITKTEKVELRKLEKVLEKRVPEEYFEIPKGELYPGVKPMYGYEWKGIPELEYITRPGTKFYPLESLRRRFYAKAGITKGTEFTYDPLTGKYVEILRVTAKKPVRPPTEPLIDIPKLLEPISRLKKVRLTKTEKAKITRLKREVEKAEHINDFEAVTRLSAEIRRIEYGRPKRVPITGLRVRREPRIERRIERRGVIREDIARISERVREDRKPVRKEIRVREEVGRVVGRDIRNIERGIREEAVPRKPPLREIREVRDIIPRIPKIRTPVIEKLPFIPRIIEPPIKPKKKEKKKRKTLKEELDDIYRKRRYPTLTPSEMLRM